MKLYRPAPRRASRFSDNDRMPQALRASALSCVNGPWSAVDADLLVVPWFEDEPASSAAALDAATGGEVARALSSKEFQGSPFDVFLAALADRSWRPRRVALIGCGKRDAAGGETLRKVAAAAAIGARQRRVASAAFVVRGHGTPAELGQAVAEGLTLAEFDGGSYKTRDTSTASPAS